MPPPPYPLTQTLFYKHARLLFLPGSPASPHTTHFLAKQEETALKFSTIWTSKISPLALNYTGTRLRLWIVRPRPMCPGR